MQLRSFGSTSDAVRGEAIAESIDLWWRMRLPTGLVMMQRSVRYVLELAHSEHLDSGVSALSKINCGMARDPSIAIQWLHDRMESEYARHPY